jgi:hypothetical protein
LIFADDATAEGATRKAVNADASASRDPIESVTDGL